jgi:competence protein ComGC
VRRHYHQVSGALLFGAGLFALVIVLLVLISIPVVRRARQANQSRICVENLNQIVAAKERYALDHELKRSASISMQDLIKDGKMIKREPICPTGGKYSVNGLEVFPTCSRGGDHVLVAPEKKPQP